MAGWSFNLHTQLNITNWTTMVCINCLILYFVFKIYHQSSRQDHWTKNKGLLYCRIFSWSQKVQEISRGPFIINGNLSLFFCQWNNKSMFICWGHINILVTCTTQRDPFQGVVFLLFEENLLDPIWVVHYLGIRPCIKQLLIGG